MITHSLQEGLENPTQHQQENITSTDSLSPLGQRHKMACQDKDTPGIILRPAKETVQLLTIILAASTHLLSNALERFAHPVENFVSDHF
jgi:hypothetical protein